MVYFTIVIYIHDIQSCIIRLICNFCFFLLANTFSRIKQFQTNLDDDPEGVKDAFRSFLSGVVTNLADKRDQEELSIVNQRSTAMAY